MSSRGARNHEKLGYEPDKRLSVTVTTRNAAAYRDAAVLLIDQLKEIYIDAILNAIDTTQWYPTVTRKDYTVGVTVSENGLDDPDQQFYENFSCGAERNYTGYCSAEVDQLIDQQSSESDTAKRKQIVWEIERKLAEDAARPAIFYPMSAACWQPYFKGHTMIVNGNYNGWRLLRTPGSTNRGLPRPSDAASARHPNKGAAILRFKITAGDFDNRTTGSSTLLSRG
jgi:peptide/nickel transport system substrate-binding protein